MKTKLTRISKRTLAMVLTVLMMFSMMIVGTISANAYTTLANKTIFFDNSKTKWSEVSVYLGHNSYTRSYPLSKIAHDIWGYTFDSSTAFTDRTALFFAPHNYAPDGNETSITTVHDTWTFQNGKTNTITANDNDGGSCFIPASSSGSTLSRRYLRVVSGDIASNGWDNTTDLMTYSGGSYTITYSNVAAGSYNFAVVGFNDWNTSYRASAIGTATNCTLTNANDNEKNIKLTLSKKSNVTITLTSANKVNVTATFITHNVSFSQPTNGEIKVNSSTTSPQSVAENTNYTVTVTPNSGYKIKSLTIGGYSETTAVGKTSAYTVTKTMGTSNVTVVATFELNTHTIEYTLGSHVHYSSVSGGTKTTDGKITATHGSTVSLTVTYDAGYEFDSANSTLDGAERSNGDKTFTFSGIKADKKITINTKQTSQNQSVTYYVDFHDNKPSNPTIKFGNETPVSLTKQGDSTVYSATVDTPYSPTTKDIVSDANISFSGKSYDVKIDKGAIDTKEIWLEAVNETSQSLKLDSATNSTPIVPSGKKRIYLAKPLSWATSEKDWNNIGIYYWGTVASPSWQQGTPMTLLGNDSSYYYYYVDVDSRVDNIIFQGWGDSTSGFDTQIKTEDIKEIGTQNYYVLSKSGSNYIGKKETKNAVVPSYTKYYKSVAMNVTEVNKDDKNTYVNIAPTYKGAKVTYTVDTNGKKVLEVDTEGNICEVKSSGTAQITVRIYGTVGALVTNTSNNDSLTYTVSVTIKDPTKFEGFKVMSLNSNTSEINIKQNGSVYPATITGVTTMLTGVANVDKNSNKGYQNSAIVTKKSEYEYEVRYAAPNNTFSGYSNIYVTATATLQSIRHIAGKRYGIDCWNKSDVKNEEITKTITKSNSNGVETSTSKMVLDGSKFDAVYVEYDYVDVTFKYDYYEYKTLRSIPKTDGKGNPIVDENGDQLYEELDFYQYDSKYVGDEDRNSQAFNEDTHIHKIYTVSNFEVRKLTADTITESNIRNSAIDAIVDLPENDYYTYSISAEDISIENKDSSKYTATVIVKMTHTPKDYTVYLNGSSVGSFKYQEYATLTADSNSKWYEIGKDDVTLATGKSYRFRVTNDINIGSESGEIEDEKFNRSIVNHTGHEITYENNTEKLVQNFYIADFFDPTKVIDPDSVPDEDGNQLPYDDVAFVGGGVMYYSLVDNVVNENVVNAGYVDGATGKANTDILKEFIMSKIEQNNGSKYTDSTELAKSIAYGTEIKPTVDRLNNRSTGLVYRYLPFTSYDRDKSGDLITDEETGEYRTTTHSNTFRYSNSMRAYQYIYASKSENKPSNAGKDMRLYAYYIYSYTAYDKETSLPETKYEVVISENYADAPTYVENAV